MIVHRSALVKEASPRFAFIVILYGGVADDGLSRHIRFGMQTNAPYDLSGDKTPNFVSSFTARVSAMICSPMILRRTS